jgi:tRNA nucleotidyltransferase (CCA-adding enzyme)
MKAYLVGGAVRDGLLGIPGADRDWVVVGATPEKMLAKGFSQVGKDFPVFLHPQTQEEYALARTERKTAAGYKGFVIHSSPEVTLEQDLARRDLTINAIAQDVSQPGSALIDPFNGQQDLKAGILRHVTDAFSEDPLRVLRIARFAARFHDFTIAPETQTLLIEMVERGELKALVAERVWQELSRGLMTDHPGRMIAVLSQCGAWQQLFPELIQDQFRLNLFEASFDIAKLWQQAVQLQIDLKGRWALLCSALHFTENNLTQSLEVLKQIHSKWRIPVDCQDAAKLLLSHGFDFFGPAVAAEAAFELLMACDAVRRPQRLQALFQTLGCIQPQACQSGGHLANWRRLHDELLAVDLKALASQAQSEGLSGLAVGRFIAATQLKALQKII